MIRKIKQVTKRFAYSALGLRPDIRVPLLTVNPGDQAWTIAADSLRKGSVIYSLGLATNIEFDLQLIARFGVDLHGFDPTSASASYLEAVPLPPEFHYHPIAVAGHDGMLSFGVPSIGSGMCPGVFTPGEAAETVQVPCKRLSTIMRELGHDEIDLLKMDIEGSEYEVIDELLSERLRVGQLLIEFHHRFKNIGMSKTLRAVRELRKAGYKLFHVSPWCEEYAFLKPGNARQ